MIMTCYVKIGPLSSKTLEWIWIIGSQPGLHRHVLPSVIPGSPNPFRLLDDLPERLPPSEPRASRHGQEADEHLLRVLRLCPGEATAFNLTFLYYTLWKGLFKVSLVHPGSTGLILLLES